MGNTADTNQHDTKGQAKLILNMEHKTVKIKQEMWRDVNWEAQA